MELQLTPDEERYLVAAFAQAPREWFRPMGVLGAVFSVRQTAGMVATLVDAGMLDGEPDCHTRLTDRGRKEAARLSRSDQPSYGEMLASSRRRRGAWQFAAACGVLGICIATLRWFQLI